MDTYLRNTFKRIEEGKNVSRNFVNALERLKKGSEQSKGDNSAFSCDLFVICAELAHKHNELDIATECLNAYFTLSPAANQYLCRAYLCHSQIVTSRCDYRQDNFDEAVVYLLKAVSLAKPNPRYHFIIYNASVLLWRFARCLLKPGFRKFLCKPLSLVVHALEDVNDTDHDWRAMLMIALVESYLDAEKLSEAAEASHSALTFIRKKAPHRFKEIFGVMIANQLVDQTKVAKDLKNSPEISIFYRLRKLKVAMEQKDSSVNASEELKKLYYAISGLDDPSEVTAGTAPSTASSGKRSLSRQQANSRPITPASPAKDERRPGGKKTVPSQSALTVQTKLSPDSPERGALLLDLAKLCVEIGNCSLAQQCVDQLRGRNLVMDKRILVELEFVECNLSIKVFGDDQENFLEHIVQKRILAIRKCEDAVVNAIRLGNPDVIQIGCITVWNLCLPLLQNSFRNSIRKPLEVIATALEDIDSLLMSLRCQIHMELAKCEEHAEQVENALQNYKKALTLDDSDTYQDRLLMAINRVQLRETLYSTPKRSEDVAAMIVEQARTSDSGTIRMKRSLLIKVGQALAPDAFDIAMDSENESKALINAEKNQEGMIKLMNARAQLYIKCVSKIPGHLHRLGRENEVERIHLWSDLAKIARKQQVWDVCRVACRFCLLYDDGRWKPSTEDLTKKKSKSLVSKKDEKEGEDGGTMASLATDGGGGSGTSSPVSRGPQQTTLQQEDILRTVAEIHCINAESLIHFLRTEGCELNNSPDPPVDSSKRPKGYVSKRLEDIPEWSEYRDWIKSLNDTTIASMMRVVMLGVDLGESWIVVNAATYFWNYNYHVIGQNRHPEIVKELESILEGLRAVGHGNSATLLVHICTSLAKGYIKPWQPETPSPDAVLKPESPAPKAKGGKKGAGAAAGTGKPGVEVPTSPEAVADFKKALEVVEFAMKVTNGSSPRDVVPLADRYPLLQIWVTVKQLLQMQINKHLGTEEEGTNEGQNLMTRAQVAVEMLCCSLNGIMEFKDGPSLTEAADMVEKASCSDTLIEVQIWTRLAAYARTVSNLYLNHDIVMKCTQKVLSYAQQAQWQGQGKVVGTAIGNSKSSKTYRYLTMQKMYAYSSCMQGESLMENLRGQTVLRRSAMNAFVQSAKFASNAENYDLVLSAAQNYWNAIKPLVNSPFERQLLKSPLTAILDCVADTVHLRTKPEVKVEQTSEATAPTPPEGDPTQASSPSKAGEEEDIPDSTEESTSSLPVEDSSETDLALHVALYGVLFQVHADQRGWKEGLDVMNKAIKVLPRTKHRLLLFKHRVMVQAKLGHNISMDIQKFKNESEEQFSKMWHKLALFSKESFDQLLCYQNAIEALTKEENTYQKVDYLIEFAQWLNVKNFTVDEVLDTLDWAADLLIDYGVKRILKEAEEKARIEAAKKNKMMAAGRKRAKASLHTLAQTTAVISSVMADGAAAASKKKEIGVTISDEAAKMSLADFNDVKLLEHLFRISTMAASMAGNSHARFTGYCLTAHSYIMRMWKVMLSSAGPAMKEIAKAAAQTEDKGAPPKKGGKGDKSEPQAPRMERPKRKGSLDHLPVAKDDWATYDVPEEVIEALGHDAMKKTGVNKDTVCRPTLFLHFLDLLTSMLRENGQGHMTLPLFAFEDLLTRSICLDEAYNIYVHLRSVEICLEMDLQEAVNYHSKLISKVFPVEIDQAMSWIEMAVYREKQYQIEQEEQRIADSLKKMMEEEKQRTGSTATPPETASKPKGDSDESSGASHFGECLGSLSLRKTWTLTAEVLIRVGLNQYAREHLNSALVSAQEFNDKPLLAKIYFLLAVLAANECQYGQALSLATSSQKTHEGEEKVWADSCQLIALCQAEDDSLGENHRAQSITTLARAHAVLKQVFDSRPFKVSEGIYIITSLEAELSKAQVTLLLGKGQTVLRPKHHNQLMACIGSWRECAGRLADAGFLRQAAQTFKQIARHLMELAAIGDAQIKHEALIMAHDVLQKGLRVGLYLHLNSVTLLPLNEMSKLSLPVARELADLHLDLGKVMCEILEMRFFEQKAAYELEKKKTHVQKVVESVVGGGASMCEVGRSWSEVTDRVEERAMSTLVAAAHLSQLSHDALPTRADALGLIGRVLRITSETLNKGGPTQWDVDNQVVVAVCNAMNGLDAVDTKSVAPSHDPGREEEDGEIEQETEQEVGEPLVWTPASEALCRIEKMSLFLIAQAQEILTQCVNVCLDKQYHSVVADASYNLVESLGQYDPSAAAQYLATFQSASASQYLLQLFDRALYEPVTSTKAASLTLSRQLRTASVSTNGLWPYVNTAINKSMEECPGWKNTRLSKEQLDLCRDLSANNLNLVILQHSPSRRFLYKALLDGGGDMVANIKRSDKAKIHAPAAPSKAKIYKSAVTFSDLEETREAMMDHRIEVMQTLMKQEYQVTLIKQRERMLEALGEDATAVLEEEIDVEDDAEVMEAGFLKVTEALNTYMDDLHDVADVAQRRLSTVPEGGKKDKEPPQVPPVEETVLLADWTLLELPLESLTKFRNPAIKSLSRDISLQMLYHRKHAAMPQVDESGAVKQPPPFVSRIPANRQEMGGKGKPVKPTGGLDREPLPHQLGVDTCGFKYMVDCQNDLIEEDDNSPMKIFEKMRATFGLQAAAKWLGISGTDHEPSHGEWEVYLKESTGFLFYGFEHLLSYISPEKLVSMGTPDTSLCLLFDLAQSGKSFTRRSNNNVHKREDVLALESPVETALLLSLAGVKCIVGNQWHCTLADNSSLFTTVMKELLEKGCTVGQAVRTTKFPHGFSRAITPGGSAPVPPKERLASAEDLGGSVAAPEDDGETASGSHGSAGQIGAGRETFNTVVYGFPNFIVT